MSDLIVGNDGVHSRVRAAIMRATYMNYSQVSPSSVDQKQQSTHRAFVQEIISNGYKELSMPPNANGQHAMANNCLHIWPRGSFMMIGLPNLDGSFTMTLFLPHTVFATLCTPVRLSIHSFFFITLLMFCISQEDMFAFFEKYFPDSLPLLGRLVPF